MPQGTGAFWDSLRTPELYRPQASERPQIDRAEVLRYLGYAGQELKPDLAERIERVICQVEETLLPSGVRQAFPVDATGTDEDGLPCVRLAGTTVELRGRDAYRHLRGACCCMLLVCTLGMASERALRLLGSQRPLESAVYDAACSAYVEAALDQMDAAVSDDAQKLRLSRNWRFSAGYGDCPLEAQDSIVATCNAGRLLGVTVTPAHLLLPSKSVTAFVGLFEGEPASANDRPGCSTCRLQGSCAFRARGTTCYRS